MKNTICPTCHKDNLIKKTIPEYHLDIMGLKNVYVMNAEVLCCSSCEDIILDLPSFGLLMLTVVEAIVYKDGGFKSEELKALLKYFEVSQKTMAQALGAPEKTVSFWINDKTKISPSYAIKLRKYFIQEFKKHIAHRKDVSKALKKKLQRANTSLNKKENIRDFLKERAKQIVKEKLAAFKDEHAENGIPTYHIPHTKAAVQIRKCE